MGEQAKRLIKAWDQPARRETMLPYLGASTCGDVADVVAALEAENARLRERVTGAERLAGEYATAISRIWEQLGDPSRSELAGRTLYDFIDALKARAEAAEARLASQERAPVVTEADVDRAQAVIEKCLYSNGGIPHDQVRMVVRMMLEAALSERQP